MAEFNPSNRSIDMPNNLSYSRGTGPNRTFESLFSGLSQTTENVTNVRDQETQTAIREDAEALFDSVNREFGVSAPPPGMEGDLSRIATLQNALAQGKISETNYYGRLATLSKQLRNKYPRYEQIVDQTIQSVTGTRPANAYRNAIFSELNRLSTEATDQEKFRRQYEKQYQGQIAAIFGPEYFMNPQDYDFEEVQAKVSSWEADRQRNESAIQRLTLQAKQGEVNKTRAKKVVASDFSFLVQSEINQAIGAEKKGFQEKLQSFMASGGENLDEFVTSLGQAETELRTALYNRGVQKYVSTGILTQDEVNQAIDDALYPIVKAKEMILGGNFEYAAKFATINKDIQDRQLHGVLEASPIARAGYGISKLNEAFGSEVLRPHAEEIETIAEEIAGRMMIGNDPGVFKRTIESGDQKVSRKTLDTALTVLKNPNINPEDLHSVMEQFFGPNAINLMSPEVVDPSDLQTVYSKLLDPQITKNIVEKGTEEDLQMYTSWAMEKFLAIPEFRAVAGDINTALRGINPEDVQIEYDAGSNRLNVSVADSALRSLPGSFNVVTPYLRQFIGSFNKALSVLDPIAEAQGTNMEELVPQLLKDMNLKLEGSKEDGFFNFLWQSLQDSDVRASSMVSEGGNGTGNNSQEAKGFTPVTPFGGETGLGVPPRPMAAPADDGRSDNGFSLMDTLPDFLTGGEKADPWFQNSFIRIGPFTGSEERNRQADARSAELRRAALTPPMQTPRAAEDASMAAPPVTPVEPPQGDGGLSQEGMTRIEGQAPSPTEIDFILSSPEIASDLAGDPVYGPELQRAASGPYTGSLSDFQGESDPVKIASAFIGLNEKRDRNVISDFIRKAAGTNIDPAQTAWCAAFVNAVLGAAGAEGTGRLNARSFLKYGTPVETPSRGDIAVFSRGNSSWQGHVGFVISEDKNSVTVLGGNQGNSVSVQKYPKSRLLGYRRPPQLG